MTKYEEYLKFFVFANPDDNMKKNLKLQFNIEIVYVPEFNSSLPFNDRYFFDK